MPKSRRTTAGTPERITVFDSFAFRLGKYPNRSVPYDLPTKVASDMNLNLGNSTGKTVWLLNYDNTWLRPDIIAGLTTAAVVIPKAMAYATVAGLPVQVGLYTAFVPMILYAALGTSRPLSVSTQRLQF